MEHDGYAADLWGHSGEVVFVEDTATREDLRLLQDAAGLEFVSYADDEIVARYEGIHLRWTPDTGAEIIVSTRQLATFEDLFVGTWLRGPDASAPAELPTPVLARLGAREAGVIEARHAGEPIATPYYAGVFDYWQREEVDTAEAADIPGFSQFMRYAEEHADTLLLEGDSAYALLEGLMVGFVGADNDQLAVSVTGPFANELASYLQDWLPNARLSLGRTVETRLSGTTLVREHGFQVDRPSEKRTNPSKTLVRRRNGVKSIYRDGRLTVGARLQWTQITGGRVATLLEEIDRTLDELTA
jgi:hypothetical protein